MAPFLGGAAARHPLSDYQASPDAPPSAPRATTPPIPVPTPVDKGLSATASLTSAPAHERESCCSPLLTFDSDDVYDVTAGRRSRDTAAGGPNALYSPPIMRNGSACEDWYRTAPPPPSGPLLDDDAEALGSQQRPTQPLRAVVAADTRTDASGGPRSANVFTVYCRAVASLMNALRDVLRHYPEHSRRLVYLDWDDTLFRTSELGERCENELSKTTSDASQHGAVKLDMRDLAEAIQDILEQFAPLRALIANSSATVAADAYKQMMELVRKIDIELALLSDETSHQPSLDERLAKQILERLFATAEDVVALRDAIDAHCAADDHLCAKAQKFYEEVWYNLQELPSTEALELLLAATDKRASALLRAAIEFGNVTIISRASPSWLEKSTKWLPDTYNLIAQYGIEVISSREYIYDIHGNRRQSSKTQPFMTQLYKCTEKEECFPEDVSVLSIGDGDDEECAANLLAQLDCEVMHIRIDPPEEIFDPKYNATVVFRDVATLMQAQEEIARALTDALEE